jgi:hypothetical protein
VQTPAVPPFLPPPAAAAPNAGTAATSIVVTMPAPTDTSAALKRQDVDEYATLDAKLREPNARKELLRKRILSWHADLAPTEGAVERGNAYDLDIGPQGNERKVSCLSRLKTYLGQGKFLAICKVTLEAFEGVVPAEDRGLFLVEAPTGGRRIKVTKRFEDAI